MQTAARPTHPTANTEVNAVLAVLLEGAQSVLGKQLVGIYLSGSLATGDFQPATSDIDFAVATEGALAPQQLSALGAMHAAIIAGRLPLAARLEGTYIPLAALRRYNPSLSVHPGIDVGGGFGMGQQGIDGIIQRHIIREHGVVVFGPDPKTLVDSVSPDDLRVATRGILEAWWLPQLEDHSRLADSEYQAYAILTMCRALYTLRFGTIVSKLHAARWAQGNLDRRWSELIARALAWRHGTTLDAMDATLNLIRNTFERIYDPNANYGTPAVEV